ncbi:hypothetical protein [Ideonella sp.]|uniref:hypothetical protein n=1 Tax=Ideonella sp. TaxID=1929293 RepID=UPI0035AD8223
MIDSKMPEGARPETKTRDYELIARLGQPSHVCHLSTASVENTVGKRRATFAKRAMVRVSVPLPKNKALCRQ